MLYLSRRHFSTGTVLDSTDSSAAGIWDVGNLNRALFHSDFLVNKEFSTSVLLDYWWVHIFILAKTHLIILILYAWCCQGRIDSKVTHGSSTNDAHQCIQKVYMIITNSPFPLFPPQRSIINLEPWLPFQMEYSRQSVLVANIMMKKRKGLLYQLLFDVSWCYVELYHT